METIKQTWMIPKDKLVKINVKLPDHLPEGEADVVMVIVPRKREEKQDIMRLAGILKGSKRFSGDPVSIQKRLRDEWA